MAGIELHCTESPATCPRCEYNLTGLTSQRCPECGTRFSAAPPPPFCVQLEHVLFAINLFAFLMLALLICASPNAGAVNPDMDEVTVWAMLLPMQGVIALAGLITGLHLFHKSGLSWSAVCGVGFPVLATMASLLLGP
jgi:hypothetical protein